MWPIGCILVLMRTVVIGCDAAHPGVHAIASAQEARELFGRHTELGETVAHLIDSGRGPVLMLDALQPTPTVDARRDATWWLY